MATAILMPKQGNTVEECLLSSWRVAVGDRVSEGDVVAEIETDKAAFEVEATASGTVLELFWEEGELVPVLVSICAVGDEGEDVSGLRPEGTGDEDEGAVVADDKADAPAEEVVSAPVAEVAGGSVSAEVMGPLSPRARRFLEEHPFAMPALAGSGPDGRILEQDVKAAWEGSARLSPVAAAMQGEGQAAPASGTGVAGMVRGADMGSEAPPAAAPVAPVAPVAPTEADAVTEKALSNIRRIIASRLHDSLAEMAQYTLNAEADVTDLLALRRRIKAEGEALGLANVNIGDMIMYATVKALQRHPEINAEFDGTTVREHRAVHLAFACDTPRGLMVPVVHDAHALSLPQLAARCKELAKAAIGGSLSPDLLAGGTFTVSNLGAFGVTTFTPVINAPQVGILGVGSTVLRPVRCGEGIEHRDLLQLSLTLNHMVVDGAPGARFLQTLRTILENLALISLAG